MVVYYYKEAVARYEHLEHQNRLVRCNVRYACVLFQQRHFQKAEFFLQQAAAKLSHEKTVSTLQIVCYHNLAVMSAMLKRPADAMASVRTYISMLRQMPPLSSTWMQMFDNTQFLCVRLNDRWPHEQHKFLGREVIEIKKNIQEAPGDFP